MMLRPLERMRVARRVPDSLQPPFKRAVSAARRLLAPLWTVEDEFLQLGPELLVNGSFDSDTAWDKGTGWSIAGGKAVATASTSRLRSLSSPLLAGKTYAVTATCTSHTSGSYKIMFEGGASLFGDKTAAGSFSGVFTAGTAGQIYVWCNSALSAEFDNISVREVLSASVYQDSAGTLPTTYGSTLGLLTDRSYGWELGPELVTNGTFETSIAGWIAQAANLTRVDGRMSCTTASGAGGAYIDVPVEANRRYEVSAQWVAASQASLRIFDGANFSTALFTGVDKSGPATDRVVITPTSSIVRLYLRNTGASTQLYDNVSARELRGNPLSQSTAGARPTLTRTPKRLGPELVVNGALDSAAGWTLSGAATISGGVCDIATAGAGWLEQGVVTKAGAVYRVTAVASLAATFCGAWDSPGRSALLSNSAAGRNPGFVEFFFTANDALSFIAFTSTGSGATRLDNISVREVLEWSPALSFNGTSNFLSAAQNPLGSSLSQPYTMIVAGVAGALSATCRACGDYVRSIGVLNTGAVALTHFTTGSVISPSGLVTTGAPFVLSASWDGTQAVVRLNGVQVQAGALGAPIGTQTAFAVGQRGNNAEYWNGLLDPFCVAVPFVMSDADRKTFERAAAQRVGATYLG